MLQIEYDLKNLARKINKKTFMTDGGSIMFEYKFKDVVEDKKTPKKKEQ